MKARRTFQVLTAILATLLAIVLLFACVLVAVQFLGITLQNDGSKISQLISNIANNIYKLSEKISFLKFDAKINNLIVFALFILVPALLLIIASSILYSKPKANKNGKPAQGKYIFANVLAIISLVLFVTIFQVYMESIIGGSSIVFRIIVGAYALIMLVCIVLSFVLGRAKKAKDAPVEENAHDDTVETEPQDGATVVDDNENNTIEPYATPVNNRDIETTEYVPQDNVTVSQVTDNAYGSGNYVSDRNKEKLRTMRDLMKAGVISEEEYLKLVHAYVKEV